MFEQSVLIPQRRPWTLAASLTLQSAIAATIVLLSIFNIERLPLINVPSVMPPLPAAPKTVELVRTSSAGASPSLLSTPVTRKAFVEPSRIPKGIADLNEINSGVIPAISSPGIPGTGVPGGIYGAVPGDVAPIAPPPPAAKTPAAVKAPAAIRIGGQVLEAKMVRRVMPVYPQMARSMRIAGKVQLVGTIGRDGAVRDLRVIEGHPLLVQAALSAVKQWLYSPTLLNGEPVEVIAPIEVNFTLTQ